MAAVTLAAALLLQGCASVGNLLPRGKARSKDDELRELRARVVELQKRATMAEVELEHLRKALAEAEEAQPAIVPPPSERVEIVEVSESGAVVGSSESSGPARTGEEPTIEVIDLDVPSVEVTPQVVERPAVEQDQAAAGEPPAAIIEEVAPGGGLAQVSEEGQALYDRGYTLYHQGRYLDAETAFQQFLGEFDRSDLADNAQFWIGEARYARADLAGALAAYREVGSRFPAGNKVADSLLKAAECLRGLGDLEGARQNYRTVIERYPSTAAAAVAEDRLRDLD